MKALLQRTGLILPACLAVLALSEPAHAQLSDAQKDAMKANCRSDYMSNCMSVRPGGIEALQCLQKNVAKLSPSCQATVKSTMAPTVAAPAAPPPVAAVPPAPAAPPPAASPPPPAAVTPSPATQPAAPVKRAPPAPARAAAHAVAPPPPAATPPPAPVITSALIAKIESLPLRKRIALAKACDRDKEAVCPRVRPGKASVVVCLLEHSPALSPYCKRALTATLQ
jgi:hypothetical protein